MHMNVNPWEASGRVMVVVCLTPHMIAILSFKTGEICVSPTSSVVENVLAPLALVNVPTSTLAPAMDIQKFFSVSQFVIWLSVTRQPYSLYNHKIQF